MYEACWCVRRDIRIRHEVGIALTSHTYSDRCWSCPNRSVRFVPTTVKRGRTKLTTSPAHSLRQCFAMKWRVFSVFPRRSLDIARNRSSDRQLSKGLLTLALQFMCQLPVQCATWAMIFALDGLNCSTPISLERYVYKRNIRLPQVFKLHKEWLWGYRSCRVITSLSTTLAHSTAQLSGVTGKHFLHKLRTPCDNQATPRLIDFTAAQTCTPAPTQIVPFHFQCMKRHMCDA